MSADPIAWLGRQQTGWPPVASACPIQMLEWKQKGWIIVPLYSAPPAQAVDLEQFRDSVLDQYAHVLDRYGTHEELIEAQQERDRLLALIDSQA